MVEKANIVLVSVLIVLLALRHASSQSAVPPKGEFQVAASPVARLSQQNLVFNPGTLKPGTDTTWTFRTSTDNAVATLLVDSEGINAGAVPRGYAQLVLRAQDELRAPNGRVLSSDDFHGYLRAMSKSFGHRSDSTVGACTGRQCPGTLELLSEGNLRFGADGSGTIDFLLGNTPRAVLTTPHGSTESVWQFRNTRIYGLDPWGAQAFDISPWGVEIGGDSANYWPPRYPGDRRDSLADARWARGSLRVGARLGVGCGVDSVFGLRGEHGAGLCVQPDANGSEDLGAEIWSPPRAMGAPAVGLRLDATRTKNTATNTGLLVSVANGTGGVGARIDGVSSAGVDYGLLIDWKDESAEHLLTAASGGRTRLDLLGNGSMVVGSAAGGGQGPGTINLSGDIFRNGAPWNKADYVFDRYFNAGFDPSAGPAGGRAYQGLRPLADVEAEVRRTRKLPGFTDQPTGVFAGNELLLARLEEAYLYLFEQRAAFDQLRSQLEALEKEVVQLRRRTR